MFSARPGGPPLHPEAALSCYNGGLRLTSARTGRFPRRFALSFAPSPRRRRTVWIGLLAGLTFTLAFLAVIPAPKSVRGRCALRAAVRWSLTETRPGALESLAVDLVSGQTLHYRLYQFDRNAFVELHFPELEFAQRSSVRWEKGRLVASISSTVLDVELAERRTQLEEAQARLRSLRSGEKPETLEQARIAVQQAEAARETYRSEVERQRDLHARGLATDSEWELVSRRDRLLALDVELARAQLQVVTSGAKPEDIRAAEQLVANLSRELEALDRMQEAQQIESPIDGELFMGGGEGVLVTVAKTENMATEILVPQRAAALPEPGQSVVVRVPGLRQASLQGSVCRVDRHILSTPTGPYIRVYALLENVDGELGEGMQGTARIHVGTERALSLVFGDFLRTLRQELAAL